MTTGPKMLPDVAERKQEPLRLPGRGEAFHHPFPDPGRLMGVLSPVEVLGASMGHRRQKLAVSDLIAGQLAVTITRGTYRKPLSNLRKNRLAATALRRDCTKMSSTSPCW